MENLGEMYEFGLDVNQDVRVVYCSCVMDVGAAVEWSWDLNGVLCVAG